jgi:catechol 2,3-dioxygenase
MNDFRLPDSTRLGGCTLRVADIDRSLAFYTDVIGLRPISAAADASAGSAPETSSEPGRSVALSATGQEPAILTLVERPGARPRPRHAAGLYHFALLVPSRRDLAASFLRLYQRGWPIDGASDHEVSEALYLADPDDNGIEIYADRPRDTWVWHGDQVYMTTRALDLRSLLAELGDQPPPWSGIAEGTVLGHVHLHVPELDAAQRFYRDVLGFDVVNDRYPGARFLSAGRYHHHIGLNIWAGVGVPPAPEDAAGLIEYEIVVPDAAARAAWLEHVRETGIEPSPAPNGWAVVDPAGVRVVVRG